MYCQLRLEAFLDINNLLLLPHIRLVWFGLYVLAQLNLSCQAEDSSLKFGIRNREEKVALKRMENYFLRLLYITEETPDLPVS